MYQESAVKFLCLFAAVTASKKTGRSADLAASGADAGDYGSSSYGGSGVGASGSAGYGTAQYLNDNSYGGEGGGSYGGSSSWTPIPPSNGNYYSVSGAGTYNGVNNNFPLSAPPSSYSGASAAAGGISHIAVPVYGRQESVISAKESSAAQSFFKNLFALYGAASNGTPRKAVASNYGTSGYSDDGSGHVPSGTGYSDNYGAGILNGALSGGLLAPQVHETTKTIPVHKTIKVPVPHPVPHPVAVPVPIKIPQPYAVKIPYPIPVEKTVQVPVEKIVHYPVEKPIPVKVIKKVPYPVIKPYPVPVPVYKVKYIYHSKRHDDQDD